eukprot:4599354-Heterocapsa_arctica.AAC.1
MPGNGDCGPKSVGPGNRRHAPFGNKSGGSKATSSGTPGENGTSNRPGFRRDEPIGGGDSGKKQICGGNRRFQSLPRDDAFLWGNRQDP